MTKLEVYDANGRLKTAAIGGSGAGALDELADVAISSPAEGDVLRQDGTEFVNVPLGDYVFLESEHVDVSAGAADAGKPVKLDAGGQLDASLLDPADLDHGSLSGLGDDDHPQYLRRDLLTSKGDLYVATGSGALSRLGVGTDGQVLAADSAQAEGVAWTTPAGGGSAADIDYTPAESSDWDTVPDKVAPALDELAERIEDVENTSNPTRLLARDESALTIASGVITISSSVGRYVISPESGYSDDLTNILGGTDGDVILLKAASGCTIKAVSSGNIARSLTLVDDGWVALLYNGTDSQWEPAEGSLANKAVTIASGAIAVTGPGFYTVSAEAGTSDILSTIYGTQKGDRIYLMADSGDTIFVDGSFSGNISGILSQDEVLVYSHILTLQNYDGTSLKVVGSVEDKVWSDTTYTTIVNSSSEITLATIPVAVGRMGTNGAIRLQAFGYSANSSGTNRSVAFRVKLGSTTLLTMSPNANSGYSHFYNLNAVIRNVGSVSSQTAVGVVVNWRNDSEYRHKIATGTASEDTSGYLNLVLTAQWSGADPANVLYHYLTEARYFGRS